MDNNSKISRDTWCLINFCCFTYYGKIGKSREHIEDYVFTGSDEKKVIPFPVYDKV